MLQCRLLSVSNLLLDNEFGPAVIPYNGKPAPQILLYIVHQSLLLATNWSFYCWLQVTCTCRYCGWLSLFILDICPFHFIFYLLAIFSIYCPFSLLSSHCLPYSQKFDPFLCIIRAQTGQQDDYLTWNFYDSYNECNYLEHLKTFWSSCLQLSLSREYSPMQNRLFCRGTGTIFRDRDEEYPWMRDRIWVRNRTGEEKWFVQLHAKAHQKDCVSSH